MPFQIRKFIGRLNLVRFDLVEFDRILEMNLDITLIVKHNAKIFFINYKLKFRILSYNSKLNLRNLRLSMQSQFVDFYCVYNTLHSIYMEYFDNSNLKNTLEL